MDENEASAWVDLVVSLRVYTKHKPRYNDRQARLKAYEEAEQYTQSKYPKLYNQRRKYNGKVKGSRQRLSI